MEELITAKKHFSRMGWLYLTGTLIVFVLQMAIGIILSIADPPWRYDGNINMLLSLAPMYLVAFPLLAFLLRKKVPRERIQKHRMTAGQFTVSAVICVGLAYAANIVGVITTSLIGVLIEGPADNPLYSVMNSLSPWSVLFFTVICAPVMEELVFRKLLVERAVRYGQGVAVAVSGLMFGLFHGNLNQFAYATVIGAFLAYLYVKTGKLKITIALHMLFNFSGGFMPVFLTRKMDLESFTAFLEYGSMSGLRELLEGKLGWFLLYAFHILFILSVFIAGLVLFIVFAAQRRFVLEPGGTGIPKGLKLSVALGNAGMAAFSVFWIVDIVCNLFG